VSRKQLVYICVIVSKYRLQFVVLSTNTTAYAGTTSLREVNSFTALIPPALSLSYLSSLSIPHPLPSSFSLSLSFLVYSYLLCPTPIIQLSAKISPIASWGWSDACGNSKFEGNDCQCNWSCRTMLYFVVRRLIMLAPSYRTVVDFYHSPSDHLLLLLAFEYANAIGLSVSIYRFLRHFLQV